MVDIFQMQVRGFREESVDNWHPTCIEDLWILLGSKSGRYQATTNRKDDECSPLYARDSYWSNLDDREDAHPIDETTHRVSEVGSRS